MRNLLLLLSMLLLINGCGKYKGEANRIPVAKIGDKILYYDQIPKLVQQGTSIADSTAIIRNYINKWVKKEVVYLKAEENLSDEYKAEINRQLEETKANLMIYHYHQQMMVQKMDTVVSDNEIYTYFSNNESSFILTNNIVKALFIKVPAEAPNLDKVRSWIRSSSNADLNQLESYCYQFAVKYDDSDEEWIAFNVLQRELPGYIDNQENFLRRTEYYETSDNNFVYFVHLRDYRLRNALSPIEYVKDEIKSIILNNRRIEYLEKLEGGIYNEAVKSGLFKIY